jgi:hypothetical protein
MSLEERITLWRARIGARWDLTLDLILLSRPAMALRNRCLRCLWEPFHD